MNRTYAVTSINGKAPPPAVGRANAYEIGLSDSALSFSLGESRCQARASYVPGTNEPGWPPLIPSPLAPSFADSEQSRMDQKPFGNQGLAA
jgi:hypothetical protein